MKKTTIGILSDSHGYLDERIKDVVNECDYIIHAGDIFNADVLSQLEPKEKLIAVAGNNDYPAAWKAEEADIVSQLPATSQLQLDSGLIIVEHGHRLGNQPEHDQFRWDHAEARLVVYGHTHRRVIDQRAEPWVVNPGASGKVRTHGGASCLILHASKVEWRIETVLFSDTEAA